MNVLAILYQLSAFIRVHLRPFSKHPLRVFNDSIYQLSLLWHFTDLYRDTGHHRRFFKRISKIWLVLATIGMLVIQYYVHSKSQNPYRSMKLNWSRFMQSCNG